MIIYNKYTTSVNMSDQELDPITSESPTKSEDYSEKLDIKDMVKDDVDDIDIKPEKKEELSKLMSCINNLPLDKKNKLLANLAKHRDVNPNGNVFYPTSKRDILKQKMHRLRVQKRNQRLGKHVLEHKMEMAEAYRKTKEKESAGEPNNTVNDADSDNKDKSTDTFNNADGE